MTRGLGTCSSTPIVSCSTTVVLSASGRRGGSATVWSAAYLSGGDGQHSAQRRPWCYRMRQHRCLSGIQRESPSQSGVAGESPIAADPRGFVLDPGYSCSAPDRIPGPAV